jgi:hypothetical protein
MARRQNAKALVAETKKKGRASLARLRAGYQDQTNRNNLAVVAGGAGAGAMRGAGMEVALGPAEFGMGAPVGVGLLLFGGKLHPQASSLGAGMLAGEAYAYVDMMMAEAVIGDDYEDDEDEDEDEE